MAAVTITLDEASPLLERVKTAAAAQGLSLVAARAVGSLVKQHLYGLDAQRHQYGNHFYRQAGDSVTTGVNSRGAFVGITQLGFAQRLFGGTIRAKNAQYLTIPAAPEAYAHRAGEFNDLDFAIVLNPKTEALQPALVRRASQAVRLVRRKQGDGTIQTHFQPGALRGGEVMFWLVRQVTQRADPTVLPYAEQMSAVAISAIQTRLDRLRDRSGATEGNS